MAPSRSYPRKWYEKSQIVHMSSLTQRMMKCNNLFDINYDSYFLSHKQKQLLFASDTKSALMTGDSHDL